MKKLTFLLIATLTAILLAACGDSTSDTDSSNQDEALSIYTTVYPLQYFAERIGGDFVNAQSIYPAGSNEHTFEPTTKDMMKLSDADLFFYIGLGLEGFVDSAEATLKGTNVKLVPTANNVSEEDLHTSTGHTHAEAIEEHGHDHEYEADEHGHNHEEGAEEHDAHVWLSPLIAQQLAAVIKDELVAKLPEQADLFEANYEALVTDLSTLHEEFETMATATTSKTFFVSHAAFGYYAGLYGFQQVPIAGLNSQSEPSQKELMAIVDFAKEENIQTIFFEQNVTSKLASIIQDEIGATTATLHNLSVLTEDDITNNEDYFTLMRANLHALQKALQ